VARELADDPFITGAVVEAGPSGHGTIRLTATDATRAMAAVFGALASRGVPTRAASVARPSLDDVFLRETGRSLRDAGSSPAAGAEAAADAVEVAA
jgi:ABC-2 type transport system ATP-binding protein